MKNYIQEYIDPFYDDFSKKVLSAENKDIHEGNTDSPILTKNQAEYFHSIVAKFLYTTRQA